MSQIIRRLLGLSGSEEQAQAAESLLAARQEGLREQLSHFNRSLAASAQLCELLKEQIHSLQGHQASLQAALQQHILQGDSPEAGAETAARLHGAGEELAGLGQQLQQAQVACEELSGARDAAIQKARQQLEKLRATLGESQRH